MNWKETLPLAEMIQWRRHFHQYPELSNEEVETSQYIYDVLSTFPNIELSRPIENSVVATLKGSAPGKTVALRADIDALPIHEEADVPFQSTKPGIMHACGHDAHTAILLGAAKVLSEMKEELTGTVKFIFQPAEEVVTGGASLLVEAGVIEDVDYIFGLHVAPTIPVGIIGTKIGAVTAAADSFEVTISGVGSHGSTPERAIDPILVGAEIVTNLNHIVSRNVSPLDNVVISIGQFTSGNAHNVIPNSATIKGTVRTNQPETRKFVQKRICEVIDYITKAYHATYGMNYELGNSAVINDEEATTIVKKAASEVVGEKGILPFPPMMGGEDFAAYTDVIKGSFMMLGVGTEEEGCGYMLHHPKFKINENCLSIGAQIEVQIILEILGKQNSL
ncbi:M20 family metallopeptidase [Microbacteriaceae bacterium 4G12]